MLTKTTFLSGQYCARQMWLGLNAAELATPLNETDVRQMRQGAEVGRLARERFADGVLIGGLANETAVQTTAAALAQGITTLFEPAFHTAEGLLARPDVLTRTAEGWHLIEVKSSTGPKPEHYQDVAFQVHVLRGAGLDVTRASLMHLNRQVRHPDLTALFVQVDITAEVEALLADIAQQITPLLAMANDPTAEPVVEIGRHCVKPEKCRFHAHCWAHIPPHQPTIYEIPHLAATKMLELQAEGHFFLRDMPADWPLSASQQLFVQRMLAQDVVINRREIGRLFGQLTYPLYFFDFETTGPAVPRYPGTAPYQAVPFQFSCHILTADGQLHHTDFLHTAPTDPRPALVAALLAAIGPEGTLVAYNKSFENGVLKALAADFPAHAEALLHMASRLWDQMDFFKQAYQDYRFGGSVSLKVVSKVLTDLRYADLAVQNGLQAQVGWEQLLEEQDPAIRAQQTADLRAYCYQDTMAMVKIHWRLAEEVQ